MVKVKDRVRQREMER